MLGSQLECQCGVMTAGECIKVEGGKLLGKVRISVQPRVFWECWPGPCKYLQPPGELQRSHLTSLLLKHYFADVTQSMCDLESDMKCQ